MNCLKRFTREKKIYCGKNYREVDLFVYNSNQAVRSKQGRSKRVKETAPAQKNLNNKKARRYFEQLVWTNTDKTWLSLTLTYEPAYFPGTLDRADKMVENYLNRLRRLYRKHGKELKYILVTTNTSGKDEAPARIHHHILVSGGVDRNAVEDMWHTKGNKIGTINADRLDMNAVTNLCEYLAKQQKRGAGKKRWTSSKNLKKPSSQSFDGELSLAKLERLANMPEDCRDIQRFFERSNRGFKVVEVKKTYNEVTSTWSFTTKLRRKE